MISRDELKILIDRLPEEKIGLVRNYLEYILDPPVLPTLEMMVRRADDLESELPERLKQLRAGNSPESICGLGGGISFGSGPARLKRNVEYSMSWEEGRARIKHTLLLHEDHEVDFVDRLQLSDDETTLIYEQEIYFGGRSVNRREEFQVVGR